MQVIGLCRFSYPAAGGFQVEHDSVAARSSYLYSEARMEERFQHFEAICLPSIRGQTDKDFKLLTLIGSDLPRPYFDRLNDLVADVPQIEIVSEEPGQNHRQVCQSVINAARKGDEVCLQFRHDDDDAISVHYIERFRTSFEVVQPLFETERMIGIDFNRGFVARPDAEGICAEESVTTYYGVALGVAVRPRIWKTIMNFGHNRLPHFMPTLTFTDTPMYVRGHNDHNDSRQKKHVKPMALPRLDQEGEAMFKEQFNICSDRVRALFAS